jgi:methionyl-tRNA synthetase
VLVYVRVCVCVCGRACVRRGCLLAFVPETQTEERAGADGRVRRVASESGHVVEWVRETNYKFRLSAHVAAVRAWLTADPARVQPPSRLREVLAWLDRDVGDISVSRLAERVDLPPPDLARTERN